MNNSVYGKTMENVRSRINFRLITTEDEALRVKNLKHFTIFNDNLVGLHINKLKVKLNKPIYLGQCILDQSKITMADFHYNFMLKNIERRNINLMMTDTDSFLYNIENQDIYKIMENNKINLIYQITLKIIFYMIRLIIKQLINLKMKKQDCK